MLFQFSKYDLFQDNWTFFVLVAMSWCEGKGFLNWKSNFFVSSIPKFSLCKARTFNVWKICLRRSSIKSSAELILSFHIKAQFYGCRKKPIKLLFCRTWRWCQVEEQLSTLNLKNTGLNPTRKWFFDLLFFSFYCKVCSTMSRGLEVRVVWAIAYGERDYRHIPLKVPNDEFHFYVCVLTLMHNQTPKPNGEVDKLDSFL